MKRTTLILMMMALAGCTPHDHDHADEHEHHGDHEEAPITDRVAVPAAVRQNLGITFVKAEERAVERTLRMPGQFELEPTATRVYHAPLPGPVELHVKPLQRVEAKQLLATVRSPKLQERQHELHRAAHEIRRAVEQVTLARAEVRAVEKRIGFLRRRMKRLGSANVRKADLEAERNKMDSRLPVLKAKLTASRADVERERHHHEVLLRALSGLTGLTVAVLEEPVETGNKDHPTQVRWDTLTRIELRAASAGVVTSVGIKPGAWAEQGATLAEVTDDRALRFRAVALQPDLARAQEGQEARIIGDYGQERATGAVHVGVAGDSTTRTFPIFVTLEEAPDWARHGVAAFVEIVVDGDSEPEVAIPREAAVRAGLKRVFFRRDPADPDKVIRVAADLGTDDGRWVVVFSGVNAGDEVVVEGAYELELASSRKPSVSGHFHADGSFHKDVKK